MIDAVAYESIDVRGTIATQGDRLSFVYRQYDGDNLTALNPLSHCGPLLGSSYQRLPNLDSQQCWQSEERVPSSQAYKKLAR